MNRKRPDPQALTDALSAAYSDVVLSPDTARRMRSTVLDSRPVFVFSAARQYIVGAAVALAALLMPIAAASQAIL